MLQKYKNKIKKYRQSKYQKIIFTKYDVNLRKLAIKEISQIKKKNDKRPSCHSCKFYLKNLNQKNLIIFYKKFNANIQLKAFYDIKTFKKKTSKNACFNSYIILSDIMMANKKVNNLQKLNTILKINDLLIFLFKKNKHNHLIDSFKKNIQYENKLIDLYI